MRLRNLLPAFMLPVLTACSPVNLLNVITPSGSYSLAKDISYGDHKRQKLDIYKPDEPKPNAPVIIYVHGGSWEDGSKNLYKFLAEGLTSEGYEVIVPNYRLYPEVKYPVFVEDSAKAVAYAATNYPGRPLVMMGHSAGGYNVLMLALNRSFLSDAGVNLCQSVSGVVSLAGPTGFIPLKKEPYISMFPDRHTGSDAPLNNITGTAPPFLLLHGQKDKTVYPQNSIALEEKITASGGLATVKLYDKLNHTDVVKVLSRHFDGDATLKADLVTFLDGLPKQRSNYCE